MRIRVVGTLNEDPDRGFVFRLTLGKGPAARAITYSVNEMLGDSEGYNPEESKPRQLTPTPEGWGDGLWAFRRHLIVVNGAGRAADEGLLLRIKHAVLHEEKLLERIKREVEAFENLAKVYTARRERIPESVRLFVWQRDQGQCVKCGSRELLEFDHIIPVSEGGSNTERNIQLLCEGCNRAKGTEV